MRLASRRLRRKRRCGTLLKEPPLQFSALPFLPYSYIESRILPRPFAAALCADRSCGRLPKWILGGPDVRSCPWTAKEDCNSSSDSSAKSIVSTSSRTACFVSRGLMHTIQKELFVLSCSLGLEPPFMDVVPGLSPAGCKERGFGKLVNFVIKERVVRST